MQVNYNKLRTQVWSVFYALTCFSLSLFAFFFVFQNKHL